MDKYELYYQVAKSHLQEQERRRRAVELKAGSVMTLGVTLLGIAGLIITLFVSEAGSLSAYSVTFAALTLAAFLLLFAFSMRTLWSADWEMRPDSNELQEHVANADYTSEQIMEWAANDMARVYVNNQAKLVDKAIMARGAMIALSAEVVFLTLLAISVVI